MERDEHLRMVGEQTLLNRDAAQLRSQFNRDKQSLLGLYNAVHSGAINQAWLEDSIALLTRIHDTQQQLQAMEGRLVEMRRLTGITP
jgi:hypothetical protein